MGHLPPQKSARGAAWVGLRRQTSRQGRRLGSTSKWGSAATVGGAPPPAGWGSAATVVGGAPPPAGWGSVATVGGAPPPNRMKRELRGSAAKPARSAAWVVGGAPPPNPFQQRPQSVAGAWMSSGPDLAGFVAVDLGEELEEALSGSEARRALEVRRVLRFLF